MRMSIEELDKVKTNILEKLERVQEDFLDVLREVYPEGCNGYICEECILNEFPMNVLSYNVCITLSRLGSKYAKDTGR